MCSWGSSRRSFMSRSHISSGGFCMFLLLVIKGLSIESKDYTTHKARAQQISTTSRSPCSWSLGRPVTPGAHRTFADACCVHHWPNWLVSCSDCSGILGALVGGCAHFSKDHTFRSSGTRGRIQEQLTCQHRVLFHVVSIYYQQL